MISARQIGKSTHIETTDVLGQKITVQTLDDSPRLSAFLLGLPNKITCVAIEPVKQPVDDEAQSIVTTQLAARSKIFENSFRVPESREALLAFFKAVGHDANIPSKAPRHPLKWLGDLFGRTTQRRRVSGTQPT